MRLTLLAACLMTAPAVAADPPTAEELFPLSVGRSWTYRVTGGGPGPGEPFVVRVTGEERIAGAKCFRLEASLGDRGVVATEHVGFTDNGVCRFKIEKEEVSPPVLFLKPLKGGVTTEWPVPDYRIGMRSASAKFTAYPPVKMDVKAGTFKAVRVTAESKESGGDGNTRKTQIWYAAGVGIVKQTIEGGRPGPPSLTLELESFDKGETPK